MIKTELAYLAGVIDSDGSIGIKKSTYRMRVIGDCKQPIYSERVSLKQVEPQAVALIYSLFGGSRFIQAPSVKKGKSLIGWQVTDKKAIEVIKAILPYLRIKRQQALNCFDLRKVKDASKKRRVARKRGHVGSAPRTQEHSAIMNSCWRKAKKLNGRA